MTAFSSVSSSPAGVAIGIAAILLMLPQCCLLILSLRKPRSKAKAALFAARLLVWAALLATLLDGRYKLEYLPYTREYPSFVLFVYRLPWLLIVAAEAASALLSAYFLYRFAKASRERPSAYSVKQTLDFLPIGVCVSEPKGSVLLSNIKMNEIARLLTGSPLSDAGLLWDTAQACGREQNGRLLVQKDGSAFVFERSGFELDGRRYSQLFADDQTEQYRAVKELEEKNARLRDLQYRLKAYKVREEDLTTKQEILNARSTIHTQLGGALLTGKYYLEHPDKVDENELRALMWQINTYLLAEVEQPEGVRDEYNDALKMAQGIGVAVVVEGEVPKDEPFYSLLGQAIAECAANTVKHASGDELRVEIAETAAERAVTITNNGSPPTAPISESGGLLSLRRSAEKAGAMMEVESAPAFLLKLTVPK